MSDDKEGTSESPLATDKGLLRLLGLFSAVVAGLWLFAFLIIVAVGAYDGSGTFGDSFGAINALFTGLAFAAVVAALVVQREDLRASLAELRLSTEALQEQAKASTQMIAETKLESTERRAAIYERFTTQQMKNARTKFWIKATNDWFSDNEYRERMLYFSKRQNDEYHEVKNDQYACSDICNFYAFIYRVFEHDDEALKLAAEEFFFHWWRGFLLSFALLSRQKWEERCTTDEHKKQVPFDRILDDILNLELAVCDSNFIPSKHIYYDDKGISELNADLFPGLEEHNRLRVQNS